MLAHDSGPGTSIATARRLEACVLTVGLIGIVELFRVGGLHLAGVSAIVLMAAFVSALRSGWGSGALSGIAGLSYYIAYSYSYAKDEAAPHSGVAWFTGISILAIVTSMAVVALVQLKAHMDRMVRTERKLRAAADHERTLLTHVLESTTDAFFRYDRNWRVTYVNRQGEKLAGMSRDALVGQIVWKKLPYLIGTVFEGEYTRALRDNVPVRFEAFHPLLESWVEVRAVPFEEGLTVYLRSIAERKQMEAKLECRLRQQGSVAELGQMALGETSIDAILDKAVHLVAGGLEVEYVKYLEVIPDSEYLLLRAGVGWREGFVGKARIVAREGSQAGYTLLCKKPVISEDLTTETRFQSPTLLVEHGVVSGVSVMVLGGNGPTGILGAHSTKRRVFSEDDVNFLQSVANVLGQAIERTAVAETLRKSELQFRQLAENINEVFYVTEPDLSRMLYISPAYEDVWGRSRASLYQHPKSWIDAIHPDDRQRVATCYEGPLQEPLDHEYRIVRPDGEQRWIRDRLFLVRDDQGRVYRHVGVAENITARKRMDESLALLSREQSARLAAEAGMKARDEVLTIVSHDLRNPLYQILLSANLLKKPHGAEVHARQVDSIVRAAENMNRLLRDLLDIASIEAGRLGVDLRPVAVESLRAEVVEMFSDRCLSRSIRLEYPPDENGLAIMADKQRIIQALGNLLSNALKFSPVGGRITVSIAGLEDRVQFAVSNAGPPIPSNHLPHLFERFWQARGADRQGIGMGLAIVRGIVEAHGGQVWVDGRQPDGPTFCFTIPVAHSESLAQPELKRSA